MNDFMIIKIIKKIYNIINSNQLISGIITGIIVYSILWLKGIIDWSYIKEFTLLIWEFIKNNPWLIANIIAFIGIIIAIKKSFSKINELLGKDKKINKEYIKKELEKLDHYEKANLRELCRIHGKRTIKMPIDEPTVSGLLYRKILYTTLRNGETVLGVGNMFNCSINPEFEEYINDKVLGLPMSEDELMSSRPEWAYKYENKLSKRKLLFG